MKNKSILPKAIFALLAILASLTALPGQSTLLFTETDWTASELSQKQNERLARLANVYPQDKIWEVAFGAIENVQQQGRIELEVPENECGTIRFKAETVEYNNSDDYLWYGEIEPYGEQECECNEGSLMLIKRQDELFGTIRLEGKVYEIEPLSGDKAAIAEVPQSRLNNAVCGVVDESQNLTAGGEGEQSVTSRENCNFVRVLFLHTTNAFSTFGNPQTAAESVIATTNIALNKSAVSGATLHLLLAGVEQIEIDETLKTSNQVLNEVRDNQTAQNLRNQYGADIVILFVNRSISSFGTVAGRAFVAASNADAYGVVQSSGPNSSFTASHEIAHIFGALHEPCVAIDAGTGCNDNATFAHAHSLQFTKKKGIWPFCSTSTHTRKTIMFSEGSDEAIQNYSNPDVNVEGQPTGVTNARDNAMILEQSACAVSGFRTLAPSLAVSLNGPYTGCVGDGAEVCAEIEGGTPGSYTLKWYVADEDGINYQYLPYNDDETCLYYPFPPAVPERYWIKVVVSDGQGNSAVAVHTLRATCGGEMGLMANPGGTGINIYPNPVGNGDFDFTFDLEEDAEAGFSVSLMNGKEILEKNLGFLPKGGYRYRTGIEMQGLQMLVLKVRKGNKVESRKFIVNR